MLHSHSVFCNLATALYDGEDAFRISHQEMIKGIAGYGYFDELVVPIIENTAWEHELADALGECIRANPRACAVLVRRHGMYVWGGTWEQAKRHGECLHYLFEVAVSLRRLGVLNLCAPPSVAVASHNKRMREETAEEAEELPEYALFDIEGTTTPISFVKDVLFPYSASNAEAFLAKAWAARDQDQNIADLAQLAGLNGGTTVASLAAAVRTLIAEDSKTPALKLLQGRIWEEAYVSGGIVGQVFDDAAACIKRLHSKGVRVAIYSSGSRRAQKLLFAHSNHGDLSKYISCYFDTASGPKRSAASYEEILRSLGAAPSRVLFVTDVHEEAQAAHSVGIKVAISVRPGNAALPAGNEFDTLSSFESLC